MRHRRRGNRSRIWDAAAREWIVSARVERFSEAAVLLALRDRPYHGYELADAVKAWGPEYTVDSGNLARLLGSLEEDGLVTSTWGDGERGAPRRIYELEPKGERLLAAWATSLATTQGLLERFCQRHDSPPGDVTHD